MKNILIIGCGLLGSSILRRIHKKKIANQIFIYEKSSANVSKIKRLKLPGIIIKNLDQAIKKSDLIILSTPMSEYKNLILKMNKSLSSKNIITDIITNRIPITVNHFDPWLFMNSVNSSPNLYDKNATIKNLRLLEIKLTIIKTGRLKAIKPLAIVKAL